MAELVDSEHSGSEIDASDKLSEQCLTFFLENDEYGIDILAVQEIHGWIEPRPIPDTPRYVCGVIDWRGLVVPVVDLRIRFNYEEAVYDKKTVYIILKLKEEQDDKAYIAAIIVDAVSDVCHFAESELKPPPALGGKVEMKFIKGIAKVNDSMVVILNLESLLNLDEG